MWGFSFVCPCCSIGVYNGVSNIFFHFSLYGKPPMTREFLMRVTRILTPTFFLSLVAYFALVLLNGFPAYATFGWGVFGLGMAHVFCQWAGSHPYTNFDGRFKSTFHTLGLLHIVAPLFAGMCAASGIIGQGADANFAPIIYIFATQFVVMMAGWYASTRLAKRYKPDWDYVQKLCANTRLIEALDNATSMSPLKRDEIETRAATMSAQQVNEMAVAIELTNKVIPEALK